MPKKIKAKDETAQASKESTVGDIFETDGELVVDVFQTHAEFVVSAAIAGVRIQDLDISIEKEMMVIRGNRQDPHAPTGAQYVYQECYWGPFSRKIVLPENINTEKADAQIEKGILTIKIPRTDLGEGKKEVELA